MGVVYVFGYVCGCGKVCGECASLNVQSCPQKRSCLWGVQFIECTKLTKKRKLFVGSVAH